MLYIQVFITIFVLIVGMMGIGVAEPIPPAGAPGVADFSGATPFTGNFRITAPDPSIILDSATVGDTDFWLGVVEDTAEDDNDLFQIGDGEVPGTNPFLTVDTSGQVGIGIAAPTNLLHVEGAQSNASFYLEPLARFNNTATSGNAAGIHAIAASTSGTGTGGYFEGSSRGVYAYIENTQTAPSLIMGSGAETYKINSNVTILRGHLSGYGHWNTDGAAQTTGSATGALITSDFEAYDAAGSIAVTTHYGIRLASYSYTDSGAAITFTNQYGIYLENTIKDGTANTTITSNYGIYLEAMTAGVTNYAIYSAGGQSYHAGDIGTDGELEVGGISADGAGTVICIKADGNLGTCSDGVSGNPAACTCA